MKINFNSIYLGFKKGISVSILPPKLDKLYNHIFIRIIIFIGELCLLFVLTNKHLLLPNLPVSIYTIICIIGLLQAIQILSIFLIKTIYGIYTLITKPEVFEVKN